MSNKLISDTKARKLGYNRRGPGKAVKGRGFDCYCVWSSDYHGDICPEHGRKGKPIPERKK